MNIKVKLLNGKIINLNCEETETINQVKLKVQEMEGIRPDQQRMLLNGKLLLDNLSLLDSSVKSNGILHLVLALRGGL